MKPLQVRLLQVCVLCIWLLTSSTGEASTDYRTMWVSTAGVDSPQCILDTLASDPLPQPRHTNETCGSLNYAITHMTNYTVILILCGTHELKPLDDSSPDNTPLSSIKRLTVVGNCSIALPQIHCTNGANLAFYKVQSIAIINLAFNNCGEQLQYSDSLSCSSVLYIQDCNTVLIAHVNITITGPYGRGISFIRDNETVADGNLWVTFHFVSIYHYGFHGSGIHCEIVTGRTKDTFLPQANLQMIQQNITVINTNAHSKISQTINFTGINITVMGDGEGGRIELSDVSANISTSGTCISISLLDNVSKFEVLLSHLLVTDFWEKLQNNRNGTLPKLVAAHHEYSFSNSKSDTDNSTACSSIKIELRNNSKENCIIVGKVWDLHRRGVTPSSAFSIEVTDHSEENSIWLQEIWLAQLKSSIISSAHRRGLQVVLTKMARRNVIRVDYLWSYSHRAYCGGGAYVEFSGKTMANLVKLSTSYFQLNHAIRGGGIAVVYKDFAMQNVFKLDNVAVSHNFAELGGGVYLILQDSSNNNTIPLTGMYVFYNIAHCGGGMFICFQERSVVSNVQMYIGYVINNTLLPSQKHDMMGGGVHVEFSTVSATFRTDNTVNITAYRFHLNAASHGIGGGISVVYKHSRYQGDNGDTVSLENLFLFSNKAVSGSACAFQSLPTHGKRLFRGVRITNTLVLLSTSYSLSLIYEQPSLLRKMDSMIASLLFFKPAEALLQKLLSQPINPSIQMKSNTNLIFVKSVQLVAGKLRIMCGMSSQGIYSLDSEIVLQAQNVMTYCVATHGGAIALYGESHITMRTNAGLIAHNTHAFQRGGAMYVSSAPGVMPVSNCFVKCENGSEITFFHNSAKAEGKAAYISDIRNCIIGKHVPLWYNYLTHAVPDSLPPKSFIVKMKPTSLIMSGPIHVASTLVNLDKSLTIHFIPGKQKRLPYTHAYDEFGNNITSVFTVQINKMDTSLPVELNPFSKYTADFTVILHGIPLHHGMAKHSFPNTSAITQTPQLVLQSIDNIDLLLVMNIELQCCPPGYIFRYGSGDMGTCHCGMHKVTGIAKCIDEEMGAALERDHWAGYLPSHDQHSCDGQKFFTGQCPPGYCQTQTITLPQNNSQQDLQDLMCNGSNRNGILCGDCIEGKGIAVNFNGIRPVCVSCEDGLSKVGILVWILSEWVPMLTFMFVLMLFNIDLVSGKFNSFLLFAQLLAFSTIRGDAELGPVHNAFVRISRFLYGMWNLDFFGVLLPPYCLVPHAHLTLLQTLLLHYSIGLFPLTVAITLTVLERSAEKWTCCHRVDQCLRRMRWWKAKYSDGMSYDRALPAFVILGFSRFLVSSSYILVHQNIIGDDGEWRKVVWWQGTVPYGSIQHIAYFIPAIIILLVFVLLPSFLLLTLPIVPQLFGRLVIAVPPLRKLQRMQTFCSNVYTDRWVYHFVNVLQGCYQEHFRSFSSLYLFHRIVHLLVAVFIPRPEDALCAQIFLTVALLLLISACQPYNSHRLNTLDAAILGNLALILILSLHITDLKTSIETRQFFASLQMILIYLPLLYPGILLGRKVYLKYKQLRCCQKQEGQREDNAEPLLEAPAERLGNLVLITELHAGVPTSEDDDDTVTPTETETETYY